METPSVDINGLLDAFVARVRSAARGDAAREVPVQDEKHLQDLVDVAGRARAQAREEVNEKYRERASEMSEVVAERQNRLEAYARRQRQAVPAVEGKFVVAGRVTDRESRVGLPHVRVRVSDLDRKHDDILGEARTDALGYFRLEYDPADFKDRDVNPEAYIEVLDAQGEVIFTSPKSFIEKSGESAFIAAPVEGDRLPTNLRIGAKVDEGILQREADLGRRERILTKRPDAAVATQPVRLAPAKEALSQRLASLVESDPRKAPLTEVEGVGRVFRERLEKEGLNNAGSVAAADAKRLAEVLQVGEGRASKIADAARRAIKDRPKGPR